MLSSTLLALGMTTMVSAHFELLYPPTAGSVDDEEPMSPCGGATVSVDDSSPEVQVGQFAISVMSSHPESDWQLSASMNTEPPFNFETVGPVIHTEGNGQFCLPSMSIPESFAGSPGVLQFVGSGHDGQLYQCAPVNFVMGMNSTIGSACMNQSSDFTATITNRMSLTDESSAEEESSSSMSMSMSMSMSESMTSTMTSTATTSDGILEPTQEVAIETLTSTESEAGAPTMGVRAFVGGIGGIGMLAAGLAL